MRRRGATTAPCVGSNRGVGAATKKGLGSWRGARLTVNPEGLAVAALTSRPVLAAWICYDQVPLLAQTTNVADYPAANLALNECGGLVLMLERDQDLLKQRCVARVPEIPYSCCSAPQLLYSPFLYLCL